MSTSEPAVRPLVYAHRGASATLPQNTLSAFDAAIRLGADGIELDIHGTRDGIPVVSHDANLAHTLGLDVTIADVTAHELRVLAPSVPTFAEVVALVAGRCHLDVEIKESGVESATLEALSTLPRDRWAISSFDWDVLRTIRRTNQQAELWVLCPSLTQAALDVAAELRATTLAVWDGAITQDVVEQATAVDRRVMAWTVNDVGRSRELATWGVEAICTDDPEAIMRGLR